MSGGIAFVLDVKAEKVNGDMVVLERLGGRLQSAGRNSRRAFGCDRLARGGKTSRRLVGQSPRFTKVLPVDYRKVVEENELVEPAHA